MRRNFIRTTFTRQLLWKRKLFDVAFEFLSLLWCMHTRLAEQQATVCCQVYSCVWRLQTAASAEKTEASVASLPPLSSLQYRYSVATVATKADISFPLSTNTSHRRTMIIMQHDYTKIASTVLTLKKSKFFIVS